MKIKDEIKKASRDMAEDILKTIDTPIKNTEGLQMRLQDLKLELVKKAAALSSLDLQSAQEMDQIWVLAQNMPDFKINDAQSVYLSPLSLGLAVIIGWLIGGILSGLLGFLAMGGDILRPLMIFIIVWTEEYLVCNPQARQRFLKYFGWIGLSAFAARAGMGLLRFGTGFGTFLGKGTGIFKSIWLVIGALLIMTFFKGKTTNLNKDKLKALLSEEIEERLNLFCTFFAQTREREQKIKLLEETCAATARVSSENELGEALLQTLDALDPQVRRFLEGKLNKSGFEQYNRDSNFIVWDADRDEGLYESQGFISNGDKAVILRKPWKKNGTINKGMVRRIVKKD